MKRKNLSTIRIITPKSYLSSAQEHSVERLLERLATEDYRRKWADVLMEHPEKLERQGIVSVIVFRLEQKWLALPTIVFKEVIENRLIHRIPHKNGKVLLGIVNLGGELQLCVALTQLLALSGPTNQYERMIAIEKEGELWVFPVDEVEGIDVWNLSQLENVPITISKSTANYLKGIMNKGNRSIGLLDEELLFYSLKRSVG